MKYIFLTIIFILCGKTSMIACESCVLGNGHSKYMPPESSSSVCCSMHRKPTSSKALKILIGCNLFKHLIWGAATCKMTSTLEMFVVNVWNVNVIGEALQIFKAPLSVLPTQPPLAPFRSFLSLPKCSPFRRLLLRPSRYLGGRLRQGLFRETHPVFLQFQ